MANRTDPSALSVHGTNPQYLVEKIVRLKIHSSQYWKEHCYALTAETLVDKAVDLEYIGGTYGGSRKPAPFLCLVLKMLQLQPELEIVYEFIKNKDYKYVSALGCFYLRLIGRPEDIYNYLEPLYNDYRKLRYRETDGKYKLIHVDEFVDELLTKEALCDTILPRLAKRQILEDSGALQLRHSVLEDLEEDDETLLAEIKENGENEPKGITAGDGELIENPRAAALKPDRSSGERSPRKKHRDDDDDEERRRKKDKKRHKKEKKSKGKIGIKSNFLLEKYRTRGSISRSRSRSRHRDDSEKSGESKSRSRSRSRSEKKKKKEKKSKWKKNLKEKRRDRSRSGSRDRRSRSRDRRDKDGDRDKDKGKDGEDAKVDENSEEYWMSLRAKLGLKPL